MPLFQNRTLIRIIGAVLFGGGAIGLRHLWPPSFYGARTLCIMCVGGVMFGLLMVASAIDFRT